MEPTIYNANNGRVTVDFSFDYITILVIDCRSVREVRWCCAAPPPPRWQSLYQTYETRRSRSANVIGYLLTPVVVYIRHTSPTVVRKENNDDKSQLIIAEQATIMFSCVCMCVNSIIRNLLIKSVW